MRARCGEVRCSGEDANVPRARTCRSSASVTSRDRRPGLSISASRAVLFAMKSSSLLSRSGCALLLALLVLPTVMSAQSAGIERARDTLRLSVDEAVTIALRQSDEMGIAAAQVDVADALYGAARANALPQLRFGGAYLHVYESARGQAVGAVFNQPNTYTTNANLTQTLFQGGRLVSATRAADDLRQASRFDEREQ